MRTPEEVSQEIKKIEDFTCSYWWPQYVAWHNSPERRWKTPTYGLVLESIIEKRGQYVEDLTRFFQDSIAIIEKARREAREKYPKMFDIEMSSKPKK